MLNIGSLLLGLLAWTIPFIAMRSPLKKCITLIIVSFTACVGALTLQLVELNNRVQMNDLAAVMDTIGTLVWVAVILAVVTIALNVVAFVVSGKKRNEEVVTTK